MTAVCWFVLEGDHEEDTHLPLPIESKSREILIGVDASQVPVRHQDGSGYIYGKIAGRQEWEDPSEFRDYAYEQMDTRLQDGLPYTHSQRVGSTP